MDAPLSGRATTADERFALFVLPEVEVLLRVARTLTPDHADAEDLVQDTLIRAYRGIGGFDGAHPRAWLLTILRNTQINRTRRRPPELLDDPDRTMATVADTSPDGQSVEALVVGATFDAVVEDAFRSLPDAFRRAVELVDISGLSYAEAAGVMGVPVGTIMSRIHRARRLRVASPPGASDETLPTPIRPSDELHAGRAAAAALPRRRPR
jgi:RNA polymerase sigma-70 factor (ECF subfamily)